MLESALLRNQACGLIVVFFVDGPTEQTHFSIFFQGSVSKRVGINYSPQFKPSPSGVSIFDAN